MKSPETAPNHPVTEPSAPLHRMLDRPRSVSELHIWLRDYAGVYSPRSPLLSSSSAPFDYLCHAYFEGSVPGCPRAPSADCVVWANRGGGKTFLGAVATLLDMLFKPGIEVRILGGSLEQSRRMYDHLRTLLDRPTFRDLIDGRPTHREIRLVNHSRVQILAQSETAVRGTRIQKLRCDEVDLFDPEIWRASQLTTRGIQFGPPWRGWVRGSVEALSTMQRPMGLMWEIVGDSRQPGHPAPPTPAANVLDPSPPNSSLPNLPDGEPPAAPVEHSKPTAPSRGEPSRTLFRWGIVDALEHCPPSRDCADCVLWSDCKGRAKERPQTQAGHVSVEDAVNQKTRVSLSVWECEMLCLRPQRSQCVFPEFDPAVHVYQPGEEARGRTAEAEIALAGTGSKRDRPAKLLLVCGLDFGFRAPTVVLWATVDTDRVVRIVAERSVAESRLEEHVEAILSNPLGRPAWVGIDPAGTSRSDQTGISNATAMRKAGLVIHASRMSTHEGLNLIRARLAPATTRSWDRTETPTDPLAPVHFDAASPSPDHPSDAAPPPALRGPSLFISSACPTLIESLQRYHYDESRPESLEPVKDGSDHAVDALRYLIINLDRLSRTTRKEY